MSAKTACHTFDKVYQCVLVLLLVISSGFALFVNSKPLDVFIFVYTMLGGIYYSIKVRGVLRFVWLFAILMAIQTLLSGEFYLKTAIYQIILFSTAGLSVLILSSNFFLYYKKIMLVISVISLLIFVPILFDYSFFGRFASLFPFHAEVVSEAYGYEFVSHNFFLIHFPPDFFQGLIRNSGPFWEPGAFGGFLILAIVLNTLAHDTLFRKENAVFFIAVVTTFSTTAYLALLFFVLAFVFLKISNHTVKWAALGFCFLLGAVCFQTVPFLGEKIRSEISETEHQAFMKGGDTRTASAYMDLKELTESATIFVFGRGSHPDVRIKGPDKEVLRTNGITDLLSRFGAVFFLFALFLLHKSFAAFVPSEKRKSRFAWIGLITLLILAFSELYFIYALFKVMMLYHLAKPQSGGTVTAHRHRLVLSEVHHKS